MSDESTLDLTLRLVACRLGWPLRTLTTAIGNRKTPACHRTRAPSSASHVTQPLLSRSARPR